MLKEKNSAIRLQSFVRARTVRIELSRQACATIIIQTRYQMFKDMRDYERKKQGVELNAPIEVIWRENGRISVYDPSTAWQADLMGFGADNSRAFAMLLAKAKKGE